ncbi:MAG TPA: hypothetical protein VFR81_13830 [Longimicrobium sp.]|nr:hypothetical protein [Longimicrobium sp.]
MSAADEHDPHLRLPRPLRLARMAEVAFIVVTSYFALLVPAGGEAVQMVRARLVFEAFAALAVLIALPRRPAPARVAAMVLAAFVLIGCVPGLVLGAGMMGGAPPAAWLSFLLSLAACASQAFVLAACLAARSSAVAERSA